MKLRISGKKKRPKNVTLSSLIFLLVPIFMLSMTFVFSAASSGLLAEEVMNVEVEGYGAIVQDDTARARDEAIRGAYRNAIERAGVEVEAITEVRDFEVFYDQIITESSGYVRDYEVIEEGRAEDGLYEVVISAEVVDKNLQEAGDERALKNLIRMAGNPVIMVSFSEIDREEQITPQYLAGLINDELGEAGFQMVDPDQVVSIRKAETDEDIVEDAVNVGERFDADIVLAGDVYITETGTYESGDVSFQGASVSITLRAVSVWSGEIIRTWQGDARETSTDYSQAVRKSAEKAAEDIKDGLVWDLPRYAGASPDEGRTVRVEVEGLSSFSRASQLAGRKEQLREVETVDLRNFEAGKAQFDVQTVGRAQDLAVRMEEMEDYELRVISFGREKIQLEIRQ